MLSNFNIDYVPFPHHNTHVFTHRTNDPVEAEDFLMQLLHAGSRIVVIRHSAGELTGEQFDRMIKVAAERLMSQLLKECLNIDSAAIRHRFKIAA